MKNIRILTILLSLLLSNLALASECGKQINVNIINTLQTNATLGDLTEKFGEWCQGEGPVSWYKGAKDKQIWFYWKKSAQPATAGNKANPVLMVTEVNANDLDEQKIIWPKEFVGQEMTVILLTEYGPQKSK